mmetsp:Transcript_16451/g.26886  ORF Transcript_16451/g.26886 Transcript_16451/m.26886 type:complete len:102 (-) Transcript_16451:311-616(-)
MPDEVIVGRDVDLLVSDYYEAKRILDGNIPQSKVHESYENGKYRIQILGGKVLNLTCSLLGTTILTRIGSKTLSISNAVSASVKASTCHQKRITCTLLYTM